MSTMESSEARTSVGPVQIGVVLLALATAAIHLYVFLIEGFLGDGSMLPIYQLLFVGNFLGYISLVVALYFIPPLASFRPIVRMLLMAMSTAAIISYFYVGVTDTIGDIDKLIEVSLIALLLIDTGVFRSREDAASWGPVAGIVMFFALYALGLLP